MDAVERAKSGHPGMPMAMAPAAYLLYTRFMRHNPRDPRWPDRDRFVLSAGHGSMLLYSALHLSGYDLPLDELKRFRQWGSKTPGHPERDRVNETPGVETTTGPLGQGLAVAVGMALAERFLRERYGEEVMDHRVFGICSDGDLQEGLSHETASLAGHLGLGRVVFLYDDNAIQLDGPTSESFSEDVPSRFRAYGWHTLSVDDANDLEALSTAIAAGVAESARPTLIAVKSIIGWPAPNRQNTSKAHGAPLGEDEVRATKKLLGWDPDAEFVVPAEAYERFSQVERGAALQAEWQDRFDAWRAERRDLAEEWDAAWSDPARPMPGLADALPGFDPSEDGALATRAAGAKVMEAFAPFTPTMVGGAADLSESTKTEFPGEAVYTREAAGRNVKFGVREHAMGAAVNGMALHGGIVKPYGSTFLMFADYMRPAIRLSALMALPVVWVFTHDSVGLGEDGPTHQPVEHYAALRAIPGLTVIRPADANETADAWRVALEDVDGPVCLLLTRQNVPVLERGSVPVTGGVARGGYVVGEVREPDVILLATGSEVAVALEAQVLLSARGVDARVVSMPSWELFDAQDAAYRDEVLPPAIRARVAVEAGVAQGWSRYVGDTGRTVTIDRFGASAPGETVLTELGITPERVARAAAQAAGRQIELPATEGTPAFEATPPQAGHS
ncbi:MAG: transketolase [Actinobacteria bacterium]|nr:transketolase [Actinomycetota bacterium]